MPAARAANHKLTNEYNTHDQYQSLLCVKCDQNETGYMTVFELKKPFQGASDLYQKHGYGAVCSKHHHLWTFYGTKFISKPPSRRTSRKRSPSNASSRGAEGGSRSGKSSRYNTASTEGGGESGGRYGRGVYYNRHKRDRQKKSDGRRSHRETSGSPPRSFISIQH
eukprot:UN25616